mmetsp:Transcript_7391/g.13155  ORF Transcript_7391/g.13155 Transcript_7391/m.13155 type:complete len:167 (-) Transcript_7391:14-514(-)
MGAFRWNMMTASSDLVQRCLQIGISLKGSGNRGKALKLELAERLAWYERGQFWGRLPPDDVVFADPAEEMKMRRVFAGKKDQATGRVGKSISEVKRMLSGESVPMPAQTSKVRVKKATKAAKQRQTAKVMKAMKATAIKPMKVATRRQVAQAMKVIVMKSMKVAKK